MIILISLVFVWLHDEIARSKGPTRVGVSLPEDRNTAGL